jgi:Na+:H+ antiporter, NhaA family
LLAIAIANSPIAWLYTGFFGTPIAVAVGDLSINKPLSLWVNDGLMAWFFFLIGLEIKREVIEGELSSRQKALLPVVAAIGGMAGPAVVYAWFNWGNADLMRGWAIPAATDIAFALGVLALLGKRVPLSLKVFLTALAIIDDLGAIIIIAIFYTADLSALALTIAALAIVALVTLNRLGVRRTDVYVGIGMILWVAVLKSGVHATLAGVITALTIPLARDGAGFSPSISMEHRLHGWVTYFILPLFAFANAGLSLDGVTGQAWTSPVTLGIAAGLIVGKQVGVMAAIGLCLLLRIATLPSQATVLQVYGVAIITGIGFTMSLFIGDLAFADPALETLVKLGVLSGSVVSAVVGYTVLKLASKPA